MHKSQSAVRSHLHFNTSVLFAFVLLSMLFPRWIKGAPLIHIRLLNDFLCKKSQIKILEIFAMPNKKLNHHSLYLRERKKMYSFLTTLQTTPALMLCLPRHTRHNHTLRRRPTDWLWRRAGCRSLALWKEKERLLLVSGSCRGERSAVSSFADWSGWFTPPQILSYLWSLC